ncbi:S41 family peptidase [Aquirhabdus parva]|uniref:S41 family peptidase n=1 Tax=Aquirhabdus parva TaxID=2283318 RepID=A0A345PA73_9GAMM|nr:S41 family peptidase [Aquirhabdus parva]AXI04182.1 S41 family peptidase [Aquirhabdus parva]
MILFDVNDLTPSNEQYLTSVSPVNTVPAKHSALKLVLALSLIPTFNLAFAAPATPTTTTTPISSNTDVDNQPLPIDAMRRFVDVYEKVRQNYVEPVSDDVLFDNALSGLLNKLDPYSDYLDAKTYDAIVDFTDGEIGQTGLSISPVNSPENTDQTTPVGTQSAPQWQITAVPKGSPAAKAGVQVGDILLKIEGKSVKTLSQSDIEQQLRGPRNSAVRLSVMQPGRHARDIRVLLAIPEDNAVKTFIQPNGLAVLQLRAFQTQTGEQISEFLDPLFKSGKLKGIVLDLRDNPGGLLTSAIEVANYFLNDGLIVYTQGRGEPEKYYRVVTPERYPAIPVYILINHYSASAAEVLTAALRDHQRATVFGVTSYGKGSVQKIWPIGQGRAIKMTVSRYFTPNGRMIEGTGIDPDVMIPEAETKPIKSTGDIIDPKDIALQQVINTLATSLKLNVVPDGSKTTDSKANEPAKPLPKLAPTNMANGKTMSLTGAPKVRSNNTQPVTENVE